MLVLDYADVHHRDHGGVTVGEDLNISRLFALLVLVLLYDLSYAGEVGCGTCVLHSSLKSTTTRISLHAFCENDNLPGALEWSHG